MSAGDTTRLLLVGAGRMGHVHARAAVGRSDLAFVALADPIAAGLNDPELAGLERFADLDAALAWGEFDAAVVAAPSDLHVAVVSALVGAGVPVLCEKPLGLTVAEATTAGERADAAGVALQVGYWRRFVPELVALKSRIAAGEFGAVTMIESCQWDLEPPPAAFRRRSGGIVRDMGVHEIDQISWLTGESLDVQAVVASQIVTTDEQVEGDPESVAVVARLSGGGIGLVSLGRRYAEGDACWLDLIGSEGVCRVDFMRGPAGDAVFLEALAEQHTAFIELVNGGQQRGATAADAVAALQALETADRLLATEVSHG